MIFTFHDHSCHLLLFQQLHSFSSSQGVIPVFPFLLWLCSQPSSDHTRKLSFFLFFYALVEVCTCACVFPDISDGNIVLLYDLKASGAPFLSPFSVPLLHVVGCNSGSNSALRSSLSLSAV